MDLREIKGIGPAKQQKLREAGISTIEQLSRADPAQLAAKSGLPLAQVRELRARAAALAVVEDAKGFGPASVPTLASQAAKEAQATLQSALDSVADELARAQKSLVKLQRQAQDAAAELADEARTPAGRKRIVAAGRSLAVEYAEQAQDAAQKAVAFVQANAPKAIAEAREAVERATKAVKDAAATAQARIASKRNGSHR
jgi:nucleotidyltransferase/DNA polymerase involved in DNA repair